MVGLAAGHSCGLLSICCYFMHCLVCLYNRLQTTTPGQIQRWKSKEMSYQWVFGLYKFWSWLCVHNSIVKMPGHYLCNWKYSRIDVELRWRPCYLIYMMYIIYMAKIKDNLKTWTKILNQSSVHIRFVLDLSKQLKLSSRNCKSSVTNRQTDRTEMGDTWYMDVSVT